MIECPIRDLHSNTQQQPLFCLLKIINGKVILETKDSKNKYRTVYWEDMKYQVQAALESAGQNPK